MNTDSRSAQAIAEQAADWLVQLSADYPDEQQRQCIERDFLSWRVADPRHEEAVARMEKLIGLMQQPALRHANRAALQAGHQQRQQRKQLHRAGTVLLLVVSLMLPGWMAFYGVSPAMLIADIYTRKGEWQYRQLADGSQLIISSNTFVNVDFNAQQRMISLEQGDILVSVAHDSQRPFVVKTRQGTVTALGTVFSVSKHDGQSQVSMLESRVRVMPQQMPEQSADIQAGQRVLFSQTHLQRLNNIDPATEKHAWLHRQMVVDDQPLTDVLTLIARQRPGFLSYDKQALAAYRVTAVLPLDDTDQALQLVADSLNLQVQHFSPWLVRIRQ